MFGFLKARTILEASGPDWLKPARPEPLDRPLSLIELVVNARRNLIGVWTADAYRAHDMDFRILRRQVVIANSPASVKAAFVNNAGPVERKGAMMRRALEPLLGDGLFISDGAVWKRRRPIVADIVHKSLVPSFMPTMVAASEDLIAAVAAKPDRTWDLLPTMAELTAAIVARSVFGSRLADVDLNEVVEGFTQYQRGVDSFNIGFFLGSSHGSAVGRSRSAQSAIQRVHAVINKVVEDHLAGRGERGSMVDRLVTRMQRTPDVKLDADALRNEAATIFMAGHETTAATLTWAFYLLAKAPWAERALHDEVDAVIGERAPTPDDIARLDYARAVIEETLRLYPPVPILPRQANAPFKLGDIDVETDALVLVVPWLLHRAHDLWDRPHHFVPERFLGEARPLPYSYIPFSIGPRICAGLNFGLTEAVICLAMIARRYRLRLPPDLVATPVCRLSLRPAEPILVSFERRT